VILGSWRRTCAKSSGPSLDAHPAQATIVVSRIRSRADMGLTSLRIWRGQLQTCASASLYHAR